jgi:hypothetical protein
VTVSRSDLRLQVEREAMGKLLQFRQGVLAAGNDGRRQIDLLEASLSTMMVVFRGAARVAGDDPPLDNEALVASIAAKAGFDATPFTRVVRHVRGAEKLNARDVAPVIDGYLNGLQRLVSYVDRIVV